MGDPVLMRGGPKPSGVLAIVRAAFPTGMCGWCLRRKRRREDAMCPRCWLELPAVVREEYLAIDGPAWANIVYARARWILEHRELPLFPSNEVGPAARRRKR